mmetsp:Transcript_7264/g.11402  ORF Transcript_7264/g.11402 Transcript_7264/m.11402 type:complete len:213 (-) Transcript_7264:1900-2538(-)
MLAEVREGLSVVGTVGNWFVGEDGVVQLVERHLADLVLETFGLLGLLGRSLNLRWSHLLDLNTRCHFRDSFLLLHRNCKCTLVLGSCQSLGRFILQRRGEGCLICFRGSSGNEGGHLRRRLLRVSRNIDLEVRSFDRSQRVRELVEGYRERLLAHLSHHLELLRRRKLRHLVEGLWLECLLREATHLGHRTHGGVRVERLPVLGQRLLRPWI